MVLSKLSIMDWRAIAALGFALPYVALTLFGGRFGWAAPTGSDALTSPITIVTLGCLLAGAALALAPVLQDGNYPVLNILVGGAMLLGFGWAVLVLAQAKYGCDPVNLLPGCG
jgi:ABC-type transport system involved in multi-copper enzyme maturation permease subunit